MHSTAQTHRHPMPSAAQSHRYPMHATAQRHSCRTTGQESLAGEFCASRIRRYVFTRKHMQKPLERGNEGGVGRRGKVVSSERAWGGFENFLWREGKERVFRAGMGRVPFPWIVTGNGMVHENMICAMEPDRQGRRERSSRSSDCTPLSSFGVVCGQARGAESAITVLHGGERAISTRFRLLHNPVPWRRTWRCVFSGTARCLR